MNRVSINHTLGTGATNKLAIALLLVGLCTFVGASVYLRQVTTLSESLKMKIEARQFAEVSGINRLSAMPDTGKAAEFKAVNVAIDDILLPWSALFGALEQANQQEVKLLAVEPKMQDYSIRIIAVAFSVGNMLAYIKRLNEHDMLNLVDLISTESVDVNGQAATQFKLKVRW